MSTTKDQCRFCVKHQSSGGDCIGAVDDKNPCPGFVNSMNWLVEMFNLQAGLNKRLGFDPAWAVDKDNPNPSLFMGEWLNNFISAMQSELSELKDCTYWKHWYKEARERRRYELHDLDHARVEIVDILLFWISLAQAAGMTARDVYDLYMLKLAVCHERRDNNCTTQEAKSFEVHADDKKAQKVMGDTYRRHLIESQDCLACHYFCVNVGDEPCLSCIKKRRQGKRCEVEAGG